MDRAHRLGQTKQVTVYRLICKGTIEERIPVEMREYCRFAVKALEDRAQEQIKESKESKALAFQEFGQRIRAKSTKILVKFLRA